MLHEAEVVVYYEINTKYVNTEWAIVQLLNFKPVGASCNQ
jgi:hypothetical protein